MKMNTKTLKVDSALEKEVETNCARLVLTKSKQDFEIIELKKQDGEYEKNFSWFWFLYNHTFGKLLADCVERKTLKVIAQNLPEDQRNDLNDPQKRATILAKARLNFGSNKFSQIFKMRTLFLNTHSKLMQRFCEKVCNSEALDIAYNVLGTFSLNGTPTYPKVHRPDILAKFHLRFPNAQGVRNRYKLVEKIYTEFGGGRTLSIACGSAQSLIDAAKEISNVSLVLSDASQDALSIAEYRAKEAHIDNKVSFIQESFWKLPKLIDGQKFDVVEMCGILDYLNDKHAVKLLNFALDSLRQCGCLIVSNMAKTGQATILTRMYNWEIIYRSPNDFSKLIKEAGGKDIKIYLEPWKIYYVAKVIKH